MPMKTLKPASPGKDKSGIASFLALLLLTSVISSSFGTDLLKEELRGSLPPRVLNQYSFPFDEKHREEWKTFYCTSSEWDTINTLVKAGSGMAPSIIEAIKRKDMYLRRYAIAALGYIQNREAIDCLSSLIRDESEIDYFRGDALQSLFQIDEKRGRLEAESVMKTLPPQNPESYYLTIARRILENPSSIEKSWSPKGAPGGITIPGRQRNQPDAANQSLNQHR